MFEMEQQERASDRLARERDFFDGLASEGSRTRRVLDQLSGGFYDKSERGCLWAPVWKSVELRGARVLDYGCGNGDFSRLLTRQGAHVWGVDISPQIITQARKATSSWDNGFPVFLVADAHSTPFPDRYFDCVMGNGALHHLDLDRAYAEMARVLKPGGRAFFMEPMYYHPLLWLLRRLTPKIHTADERPLSLGDLEKARRWFRTVSHQEHFLLAVCAAPAHLLGKTVALAAIRSVDFVDQILLQIAPSLRKLAWLTMLVMEK